VKLDLTEQEQFDLMITRTKRQSEIANELVRDNPSLPTLTAIVMAGDMAHAEQIDLFISKKLMTVEEAKIHIGSYARLDWLIDKYQKGLLADNWLLKEFPNEWVSCDPNDTDPKYLKLWKKAKKMNLGNMIHDGALIEFKGGYLTVYRGQQSKHEPIGISWTTNFDVAKKFATGAGLRTRVNGIVIEKKIRWNDIIAYMTGRGESEIICDPKKLFGVKRIFNIDKEMNVELAKQERRTLIVKKDPNDIEGLPHGHLVNQKIWRCDECDFSNQGYMDKCAHCGELRS
jgi:hypothetical protein